MPVVYYIVWNSYVVVKYGGAWVPMVSNCFLREASKQSVSSWTCWWLNNVNNMLFLYIIYYIQCKCFSCYSIFSSNHLWRSRNIVSHASWMSFQFSFPGTAVGTAVPCCLTWMGLTASSWLAGRKVSPRDRACRGGSQEFKEWTWMNCCDHKEPITISFQNQCSEDILMKA